MTATALDGHIEITPGVADGKPWLAGHRITVRNVAVWHARLGMSAARIASEYRLSPAAVHAALAYYHDHRDEIDRRLLDDEAFADAVRARTPSKLNRSSPAPRPV